mgnify:FL=1
MIEQGHFYKITFKDQLNWPEEVLVVNILESEIERGYVCIMPNHTPNAMHDCTTTYWDKGYSHSGSCRIEDADIVPMTPEEIETFKKKLFMFGRSNRMVRS